MKKAGKIIGFVILGMLLHSVARASYVKDVYKATVDKDGVQRIEMLAGSYFFKPNDIIVKVNTPVELVVKKESGFIPHDIVLNAPNAGINVKVDLSTEPRVIKFTPMKVGKYSFYCDHRFLFWSHRTKGMEGVLEVID